MKQYMCYWGHGYHRGPFVKLETELNFMDDNGYGEEEIKAVMALELYETANLSDMGGEHIVTRVA